MIRLLINKFVCFKFLLTSTESKGPAHTVLGTPGPVAVVCAMVWSDLLVELKVVCYRARNGNKQLNVFSYV